MRLRLLCIFIFSFLYSESIAQNSEEAIVLGQKVQIESIVLDETRELWISTPQNYANSDEQYPVLYLLDGDSHFAHTSATVEFLARSNRIPGLIVVAILNTHRGRDLTPVSQDPDDATSNPDHGGADNFLQFLQEELFPYVEEAYRTRPYRVLVGHSLGGLFAIHTLTTRPDVFNAYIAISPSLQWSNQGLVQQAADFFHATPELQIDLYMTAANEGGSLLGGIRKIAGILEEDTPKGLRWDFKHMPEESHNSAPLHSIYYGLESVFEGWSPRDAFAIYELGGIEAINNYYMKGGSRFGYEKTMPPSLILQLADQLIEMNRLDEAATLITEDFPAVPPSYFLNLLAEKYAADGNSALAEDFYMRSLTLNPTDPIAKQRLVEMGVDTSGLLPGITLSEAILANYVGDYRPFPTLTFTIFSEESKLFFQDTAQRPVELVPISESRFILTGDDSQLQFFTDEGSRANRLVLYKFGQELEAPRVD